MGDSVEQPPAVRSSANSISAELAGEILAGSELGNLPEDSALLLDKPAALLSGGLIGVDTLFGEAAAAAGHLVVHWVAPSTRVSKRAQELDGGGSLCRLGPEALGHPKVLAALDRCAKIRCGAASFEELCSKSSAYRERAENLQRCFFQVARASAVYVVAHRPAVADDAGLPRMDLTGDLGWAAQMYIDRFEPFGDENNSLLRLFLFDDAAAGSPEHLNDVTTARRWSFWQAPSSRNGLSEGCWTRFGVPEPVLHSTAASAWKAGAAPPAPFGFYAGLGASRMDWSCTRHDEALAQVYAARPEDRSLRKRKGVGKGKGTAGTGAGDALPDMEV
ncbi:unnamed protein product [Polarella glacialis]|uniref:Uncharacterized protein n=1 Tax=Polarella glacialis TaxID=89957 RepID=A0A813DKW8_POLGL|nr:unnamed protein product [Polarella glacialis]CAE8625191.1 unnamed protein product [Polarella glacialis]CAE8732104.1 unnamed protein product [Polarella glacialis]